jgi:hypothetical protein
MALRVLVSSINKSDIQNPHERIINIGGINPDNSCWKMSQSKAIRYIEDRTYDFFVSIKGTTTDVIIGTYNGNKYLKTIPDATDKNNLLELPECP